MNEQQRLLLVIALSIGIISGWQWLMTRDRPEGEWANAPMAEQVIPAQDATGAGEPTLNPGTEFAEKGLGAVPNQEVYPEVPRTTHAFSTEVLAGEITNKGLQFTRLNLRKYLERAEDAGEESTSALPELVSLLAGRGEGSQWQGRLHWQLGSVNQPEFVGTPGENGALVFKSVNTGPMETVVEVAPRALDYAIDYRVRVHNRGSLAAPASLHMELGVDEAGVESGGFGAAAQGAQALCALSDDIERQSAGDVEDGPWTAPTKSRWAGLDKQYFVLAALGHEESFAGDCAIAGSGTVLTVRQEVGTGTVNPGEVWERVFTLYAGPKRDEQLKAVSEELPEIIDYDFIGIPLGFLARPMVYILNLFQGFTLSWGVAIMLLTLTVKVILFPVTYKSIVSMRKMQLLKPQLDKIKEQWPDDRERQQTEQLKIFKEKGVNPLGGCLPMLLQMPVWVALYRMLWSSVDLYQQPFLWLVDLTAKEPFPLLAIGLGALTFLQQKITPTSTDSQQAKVMMLMMPIMLTFFMLALPSGLVLYIFVNSVLTIAQTVAINKCQPAL